MKAHKNIAFFNWIFLCFYCKFVQCDELSPPNSCPSLNDGDNHTQSEFFSMLVDPCRYDKLLRPGTFPPLKVYVKCYIYYLQAAEDEDMFFNVHFLLQLRFHDKRLEYEDISPKRKNIIGEEELYSNIWTPLIFLSNEKKSTIMGSDKKYVLVSINPNGEVFVSRRFEASFYCWMNLHKFPFDTQVCSINFESWTYNASDVELVWEEELGVALSSEVQISRFSIVDLWLNETYVEADWRNPKHGGLTGNYSALNFHFKISRQVGYYMLGFYVPSCMIVAISWFSFWLQPDAAPPRITLATTTMLSFITLASNQAKSVKVSYIKANEIWFFVCTGFIFGSLVEFAFVYTIWRRKQSVILKEVSSMNILKSTLTPRLARKEFAQSRSKPSFQLSRTSIGSTVSLEKNESNKLDNNFLSVHPTPVLTPTPTIISCYGDEDNHFPGDTVKDPKKDDIWITMTPQQITMLIDKRSRVFFPLSFIVFLILYFSLLYLL